MMTLDQSLQKSLETLHALRTIRPAIDAAGDLILETLKTGNKLIACSPLHNHFLFKGQHEIKIVTRFWIAGIFLAILAIITLKVR